MKIKNSILLPIFLFNCLYLTGCSNGKDLSSYTYIELMEMLFDEAKKSEGGDFIFDKKSDGSAEYHISSLEENVVTIYLINNETFHTKTYFELPVQENVNEVFEGNEYVYTSNDQLICTGKFDLPNSYLDNTKITYKEHSGTDLASSSLRIRISLLIVTLRNYCQSKYQTIIEDVGLFNHFFDYRKNTKNH